jgi:zinc transport system substrate-binding protein
MKIIYSIFSIFLSFISINTCYSATKEVAQPTVITSIAPYNVFVQQLAKDFVTVKALVPENANPHLFEPSPEQVELLKDATLWIRTGEPFETKLLKAVKEQNPKIKILNVWENISLLSANPRYSLQATPKNWDRHIWLSPCRVEKQATEIAQALFELCPSHKENIQNNLEFFIVELKSTDLALKTLLKPLKGKTILVSHPSFAYFCHDYGLKQLSIEFDGRDPLPKEVSHILEQAKKNPVQAVIVQPQFDPKGAKLFATKLKLPLIQMNPFSFDYFQNLKEFAQKLSKDHD